MKKGDRIYIEDSFFLRKGFYYFDNYDIHSESFAYVRNDQHMLFWVPISFINNIKKDRKLKLKKIYEKR